MQRHRTSGAILRRSFSLTVIVICVLALFESGHASAMICEGDAPRVDAIVDAMGKEKRQMSVPVPISSSTRLFTTADPADEPPEPKRACSNFGDDDCDWQMPSRAPSKPPLAEKDSQRTLAPNSQQPLLSEQHAKLGHPASAGCLRPGFAHSIFRPPRIRRFS